MSGYSKVTDNKVKKMLKAMGVNMSKIPVSFCECASFRRSSLNVGRRSSGAFCLVAGSWSGSYP
jgi:hypothetical protein